MTDNKPAVVGDLNMLTQGRTQTLGIPYVSERLGCMCISLTCLDAEFRSCDQDTNDLQIFVQCCLRKALV